LPKENEAKEKAPTQKIISTHRFWLFLKIFWSQNDSHLPWMPHPPLCPYFSGSTVDFFQFCKI